MNEMNGNEILNAYITHAYNHNYIFCYTENGMVYGARTLNAENILNAITYEDISSAKAGGNTISIRYRPNKTQRNIIKKIALEILTLCTIEELEEEYKTARKNRGEIVERKTAEKFNGKQIGKPNANFTTQGDIEINGIQYQVKFNKATFTNEKTLKNMGIA